MWGRISKEYETKTRQYGIQLYHDKLYGAGPFKYQFKNINADTPEAFQSNPDLQRIYSYVQTFLRANGITIEPQKYLGDGVYGTVIAVRYEDAHRHEDSIAMKIQFIPKVGNRYDVYTTNGIWNYYKPVPHQDISDTIVPEYTAKYYTNNIPEITVMYNDRRLIMPTNNPAFGESLRDYLTDHFVRKGWNDPFDLDTVEIIFSERLHGANFYDIARYYRAIPPSSPSHPSPPPPQGYPARDQLGRIFEFYANLVEHCVNRNILVLDAHYANISLRNPPIDVNDVPPAAWA